MTARLLAALGALAIMGTTFAFWKASRVDLVPAAGAAMRDPQERRRLGLLTSLPIMFGERFGLDGGNAAVAAALGGTYDVQPVAIADMVSLAQHSLLLMAHPRAQPAEALVDLDNWVRNGGRLLLLADPQLDWESDRPLGDKLRPPPDFADTGLLDHWGLTLDAPTANGSVNIDADGLAIAASSPGRLSSDGRRCSLVAGGFIARCQVGAGLVTVIADADFLHVEGAGALDGPTRQNLDLVMRELTRLER